MNQIYWQNIPAALIAAPHWVVWKLETRDEKPTKVPYNAKTGGRAMSNMKATWAPFAQARRVFEAGGYDGVGFMLEPSLGVIGVDLDKCLDQMTGAVSDLASYTLDVLDTYCEITPSGTGLRFFAYGSLPPDGRRNAKLDAEMYSSVRFLTITGQRWQGVPEDVEIRPAQVLALHERIFGKPTSDAPKPRQSPETFSGDDAELLRKMFASQSGDKCARLYAGDASDYGSQSEADSALCFHLAFWCGRDASRVDRLFRGSGLMREKWDERHGADGSTYGGMTVARACDKVRDTYKPPEPPVRLKGHSARHYVNTGDEGAEEVEDETLEDVSDDAVPNPYAIENGRIVFVIEKTNRQGETVTSANIVADFAAHIEEEIAVEDGEPSYHVAVRTPGRYGTMRRLEIPAEQFASDRTLGAKLSTTAGAQFGVRAGMEKHLPSAIKLLTKEFSRSERFERTGWRERLGEETTFLIPGLLAPNVSVHVPRKLAYHLAPTAEEKKGLEALYALVQAQEKSATTLALSFLFQAPLCALAGWRNERYCLFIAGRTGTFKSSWAQVAMCLYGPDFLVDQNVIKWGEGSTNTALMLYAAHARDLPLLIDNYKPNTGGGARNFVSLIHNILEGSDKDRGTKEIKLRDAKLIDTHPFCTGEDLPDSDAASQSRLLSARFTSHARDGKMLDVAKNLSPHLCALPRAWIKWFDSVEGRVAAQQANGLTPHYRAQWAAFLGERQPDMANPLRVATNLATNQLTWETLQKHPLLREFALEYREQHTSGLEEVGGSLAASTVDASESTRYSAAIRELLDTTRCVLISRSQSIPPDQVDRIIGYWDDEPANHGGAFLLPGAAMKAVLGHIGRDGLNGLSENMIYRQLREDGVLASWNSDSPLKTVRVGKGSQRLLHLKAVALEGAELPENSYSDAQVGGVTHG